MKMIIPVTTIAVATAVGVRGWWWYREVDPEPVRFCEEEIKNRLRAPSTYVRREVFVRVEPHEYTRDAYNAARHRLGLGDLEPRLDEFGRDVGGMLTDSLGEDRGFSVVNVLIDYEASNAFGVMLAGQALCQWIQFGRTMEDIRWLDTGETPDQVVME